MNEIFLRPHDRYSERPGSFELIPGDAFTTLTQFATTTARYPGARSERSSLVGELSPGKSCGGTRNLAARVGRLSSLAPTMIQEIGFAHRLSAGGRSHE